MPLEPFFAGPGLDRADQLRGDAAAIRALAARGDARQIVWREGFPAIGESGTLQWGAVTSPDLFLGLAGDGAPCFCALQSSAGEVRAGFAILAMLAPQDAPLLAAALSLAGWHARHLFCATCGAPSEPERGGWSRRCPACAAQHFPRVDPVVIMLAEHDGKVLLGRQPHYPPGRYSALAGFVEVGETIEAAVARELREEAGIAVRDVRYLASQPWPFPSSLMIGCHARALGRELLIDTTELEDARWFSRAEVAAALGGAADSTFQPPSSYAIARTLLEWWLSA